MKKALSLLFLALTLGSGGVFSKAQARATQHSISCEGHFIKVIQNSNALAHLMGRLKLFDVEIMSMYDDNQVIPLGQIILVLQEKSAPQILLGKKLGPAVWRYRTKEGKTMLLDFRSHGQKLRRELAHNRPHSSRCVIKN